jgi:carbonic anhydrase/acetyltransferase-like protein (isoleucine patch superfamily)
MTVLPYLHHTPQIAPTAFVADNASVIGDVHIANDAVILFGAVMRGDFEAIHFGEGSNLQDNCVIHTDEDFPTRVGKFVSIGHGAIVHGATVEDRCLIGMGAIVLNGAVIGEGSLVAAGSVVLEGTQVPPGSLVAGLPGKVRRPLTDEEKQQIIVNAEIYIARGAVYRETPGA